MVQRRRRDRQISVIIEENLQLGAARLRARGISADWLTVVSGELDHDEDSPLFPVWRDSSGRVLPRWPDLSDWMKVRMGIVAMSSFECLTFHVNLHPDFEAELVSAGRDPCKEFRDRLRVELRRAGQDQREHLFVMESYAKDRKTQVRLHIHGAAFVETLAQGEVLKRAAYRAAGQGVGDRDTRIRAYSAKSYWGGGLRFTDYIFKVIDLPDARLPGRRMSMTRSMTQGAQDFYEYAAFGEKAQDRSRPLRAVKVTMP